MPRTVSSLLAKARTSSMVSSSCPTPRWDSASHCSGMSTDRGRGEPVDGQHAERRGQSMRMRSYRSRTGSSARASTCSRPVRVRRWTSEPARSMVAGQQVEDRRRREPGRPRRRRCRGGRRRRAASWSSASGSNPREKVRQACGSRSTTRVRRPELGRRHPERVDGRRLGHATLLVGHGQDVGHARSLRPRAGSDRLTAGRSESGLRIRRSR